MSNLWNAHKARCDAVQRRGVQLRLKAAISNLASLGEANLYDVELETLNLARSSLAKVEADMRAAGPGALMAEPPPSTPRARSWTCEW